MFLPSVWVQPDPYFPRGIGEMLAAEATGEQPLRMYLAGGVAIATADGRVVGERAFPGRQGRRLFVRLASAHRALRAEDLADDLWQADWPEGWSVALPAIVRKPPG